MKRINLDKLRLVAKFYDAMSKQEITYENAIWRLHKELNNTFYCVIHSKRIIL